MARPPPRPPTKPPAVPLQVNNNIRLSCLMQRTTAPPQNNRNFTYLRLSAPHNRPRNQIKQQGHFKGKVSMNKMYIAEIFVSKFSY